MVRPVVENPDEGDTDMRTVPRPKRTAPRERVATQAEIADATRRCREAREQHRVLAPAPEPQQANLCGALVLLARWRRCSICGSESLFTDERGRADSDVECGLCVQVREDLAKRLRFVKLSERVRFHLGALCSTGNDNGGAVA